ncbi:MAG: response regulator [Deltaproteobacteria bacterium]|nr:response regulator [Deltaproteobacteria bacterium]
MGSDTLKKVNGPPNRKNILIVDDEEGVCETLSRIADRIGGNCVSAGTAEEARQCISERHFDLIMCDIRLPGESGIDLIKEMIAEHAHTAVIMVTVVDDFETVERAVEIGVYGYIVKPFKISEVLINIVSALRRRELEAESRTYRENLEQKVADRTAELGEILNGIIQVITRTVESRDPYTAGHQRRVADLAAAVAQEMGAPQDQIKGIHMAGLIHDVGKIFIPAEILSKSGPLKEMEVALIQNHPQAGYDIVKGIRFPWPLADTILQHHERMDGSGYPRGLRREQILVEARIIAVADVVEAMSFHRPYRAPLGIDAALKEITDNKGVLYDETAVDACLKLFTQKKFHWGVEKLIAREAEDTAVDKIGLEIPRGRGETILVVDDEAPVLNLAGKILAGLNYTVLATQTPEKALAMVRSHGDDIHLVLCDVVMPGMSGKELAEKISNLRPNAKTLFMSGNQRIAQLNDAVQEAGVHFIEKPFAPEALARKVREVLGIE